MKTQIYKECKVTENKDGTFSIAGSRQLKLDLDANHTFKSLDEVHQAIDKAEEAAKAILGSCKELADKINAAQTDVVALNTAAEDNGRKAIQKAIAIGELLIEVKKQTGGHFSLWRAENCKSICEKTSQNLMRLASAYPQHVAELDKCTSIRQAYKVIGVIKPAKTNAAAAGSANPPTPPTSTTTGSTAATPTGPSPVSATSSNGGLTSAAGNGVTVSMGKGGEPLEHQPLEDLVEAIMFQLDGLNDDKSKSVAFETLQPLKEWLESEVFAN